MAGCDKIVNKHSSPRQNPSFQTRLLNFGIDNLLGVYVILT